MRRALLSGCWDIRIASSLPDTPDRPPTRSMELTGCPRVNLQHKLKPYITSNRQGAGKERCNEQNECSNSSSSSSKNMKDTDLTENNIQLQLYT